MKNTRIGISIGDINGVGLEVILKTLSNPKICEMFTPVVYGSSKVVSYHKNIVNIELKYQQCRGADRIQDNKVNIVNCWQENVNITLGQATEEGGQYAMVSLERAVRDLRDGLIDGLVTAPINKFAMQMAKFPYPGHTEYLTKELGNQESLMFMVNENLRVGLVTNHLPLGAVAQTISKKLILQKIELMEKSLRRDFGIERPTIAVLGLNPHAGDGGAIGDEEERIIRPAIVESKKSGKIVMGPFPADGFFGSNEYKKFDGILAMYHDQGLVPFKLLSFGQGINFTAGLNAVRTSPDHGTAYDIAGKNVADPSSFRTALFAAVDIVRQRTQYDEDHANPVQRRDPDDNRRRKKGKQRDEEE